MTKVYRVPASVGAHLERSTIPKAYHTRPNCPHLQRKDVARVIETTREHAERKGLDECKRCSGEYNRGRGRGQECPFCGKTVGKLPSHLPCPDA